MKYDPLSEADPFIYDVRPEIEKIQEARPADEKPIEAVQVTAKGQVLKVWILPTGNEFIKNPQKRHKRPEGNPGTNFEFVQADFAQIETPAVKIAPKQASQIYRKWGAMPFVWPITRQPLNCLN